MINQALKIDALYFLCNYLNFTTKMWYMFEDFLNSMDKKSSWTTADKFYI